MKLKLVRCHFGEDEQIFGDGHVTEDGQIFVCGKNPHCELPKGSEVIDFCYGTSGKRTYITFVCPDKDVEMIDYKFYVFNEDDYIPNDWKNYSCYLGRTASRQHVFGDKPVSFVSKSLC